MLFTDAVIGLPPDADPAERYAADELQACLRQVCSGQYPIMISPEESKPAILLGRTVVAPLLPAFDWDGLHEDGCIVQQMGNRLLLAGATPRGTLYAVYHFLDRILGCRWFTPECSVIPRRKELDIDDVALRHVPQFRYREPYFSCVWDAPDWQARNYVNGNRSQLEARHGGRWHFAADGFGHTFFPLVPPEDFFDQHPDYYSEINGRRTYMGAQLCLTNPGVLEVVCERIRQWLRDDPEARVVSITQNDWNGWCQCTACRAIDEAEGSPSGTMIAFVNAVAERLGAEFPHVFFDTFAYTYTVHPPKTLTPRMNVVVRLCNIAPCCDGHPLEHCKDNQWFHEVLTGWGKIAPELFVWDYFNNFSHYFQPFPNIDALASDLRLYARTGVTGLFCQGDGHPPKGCGDMAELRAWLVARLLWDPEQDVWSLVDEFLAHYYGPAAPLLRDYLELLHDQARKPDVHFNLFTPLESPVVAGDVIPRCEAIFNRAEAIVADDPLLLDRVRAARLPVDYMFWKRHLKFVIQRDQYLPQDDGVKSRLERFFAIAEAHGAKALRERGAPISQLISLAQGYDLVTLNQGTLRARIAPALGGRLLSFEDIENSTEWMSTGTPDQIDYPCSGGYEEYTEHRWRTPGWNEEYVIVSLTEDAVKLSSCLENGFMLTRSYQIDSHGLQIRSEIRNNTDGRLNGCFRSLPEFSVGSLSTAEVHVLRTGDQWLILAPWQTSTAESGSGWLEEAVMPRGTCRLRRADRILTLQFDPVQMDKVLFDWDRRTNTIRLGLMSHGYVLEPGETFTVEQQWQVTRRP